MTDDNPLSFSMDLDDHVTEVPDEIDLRETYGDIGFDDFMAQHGIGYLGIELEQDDDDRSWAHPLTLQNSALVGRLAEGIVELGWNDLVETGEGVDEDGITWIGYRLR